MTETEMVATLTGKGMSEDDARAKVALYIEAKNPKIREAPKSDSPKLAVQATRVKASGSGPKEPDRPVTMDKKPLDAPRKMGGWTDEPAFGGAEWRLSETDDVVGAPVKPATYEDAKAEWEASPEGKAYAAARARESAIQSGVADLGRQGIGLAGRAMALPVVAGATLVSEVGGAMGDAYQAEKAKSDEMRAASAKKFPPRPEDFPQPERKAAPVTDQEYLEMNTKPAMGPERAPELTPEKKAEAELLRAGFTEKELEGADLLALYKEFLGG